MWCNSSQLVHDHVVAGNFASAMSLLRDQVGVVEFEPLQPLFLSLYSRGWLAYMAPPGPMPFLMHPLRNWNSKVCSPSQPFHLDIIW